MNKKNILSCKVIVVLFSIAVLLDGCTSHVETPENEQQAPKIQEIRITPANPSVVVGKAMLLTASAYDTSGNPVSVSNESISWSSANTAIAVIDKNGLVTGVSEGSTQLSAAESASGIKTSITIKVTYDIAYLRVIPDTQEIKIGKTVQFTVSAYDSSGNILPLLSDRFSWASSTPSAASVDKNGIVTGLSEGSTQIAATESVSGKSISVIMNVKYDIAYLRITPDVQDIQTGRTAQLSASAYDSSGNKLPLSSDRFSWTSSDPLVLTVDKNGRVTGTDGGSATISVRESSSLVTDNITITVKYDFCGKDLSRDEFMDFFNGNLVIVGAYRDKGSTSSDIIKGLIEDIVLNGIDFTSLSDYKISFNDGVYKVSKDGTGISFKLYFAKDLGTYHTGDLIPYNLFDKETFISNIKISISLKGVKYNFDHGPLYDFIDGDISFAGMDISSLNVSFRLRTDYIAFMVNSKEIYNGVPPRDKDTLTLSITTSLAPFDNIHNQFYTGGYGISYDGTVYNSTYYGIKQDFHDSVFLMTKDATGWFWEGDYKSKVEKDKDIYYQKGFVSNRSQNYTEYYCDEGLDIETKVGVAKHNLDLKGGVFTFTNGTEVRYGLESF
ncbi:MAG: Ig-like domain-containing protein [Nitrospirae bacterium]|nr:Ig-like domain-containing protein [Nitrospirota bacterium]